MSRVDAAAAMDRLPWLPDEPQPPRATARGGALMGWSAAAIALALAVGLWIGVTSIDQSVLPNAQQAQPTATVRLPEARPAAPAGARTPMEPKVKLPPAPEVRSAPSREVPIAAAQPSKAAPLAADRSSAAPSEASATSRWRRRRLRRRARFPARAERCRSVPLGRRRKPGTGGAMWSGPTRASPDWMPWSQPAAIRKDGFTIASRSARTRRRIPKCSVNGCRRSNSAARLSACRDMRRSSGERRARLRRAVAMAGAGRG